MSSPSSSTGAPGNIAGDVVNEEPVAGPTEAAPEIAAEEAPVAAGSDAAAAPSKPKRFQSLVDLLHDLAIAVVVCVLLITYVVQAFKVQGTSMSPQLRDGERILVNKFLYYFDDIGRGDVVVFWYPEDPQLSFIKRVVALPGETVEIRSGAVFVNGSFIEEPYVAGANVDLRGYGPKEVTPGHFFVLGDNRKGSNDSRSWGLVPQRYIYGKAFLRIWPPSDIGVVH